MNGMTNLVFFALTFKFSPNAKSDIPDASSVSSLLIEERIWIEVDTTYATFSPPEDLSKVLLANGDGSLNWWFVNTMATLARIAQSFAVRSILPMSFALRPISCEYSPFSFCSISVFVRSIPSESRTMIALIFSLSFLSAL